MSSSRVIGRSLFYVLLVVLSAAAAAAQEFGTLSIQARPAGAEIFIDGEHWTGSGETGPLKCSWPPGRTASRSARRAGSHTRPT